jgi:hypothetical protein
MEADEDASIVGSGGSALAPVDERAVALKQGKIVSLAGDKGMDVHTRGAVVHIGGGSAAMVSTSEKGVTRVANLSGGTANVTVQGSNGQVRIINAEADEEIVISDAGADDEELIPTDGVDRIEITATLLFSEKRVQKNKFNRRLMAQKDWLLRCDNGCFSMKVKKRWQDVHDQMKQAAWTSPAEKPRVSEELADPVFKPIAYIQPSASAIKGILTLATQQVIVKHDGKAEFNMEGPGVVNIKRGELILVALNKTAVRLNGTNLYMDPDSVVLVNAEGGITKIYNLYDDHRNAVRAASGDHVIGIDIGKEVVLGDTSSLLVKAMQRDSVARRHVRNYELGTRGSACLAEYSFVSMLDVHHVLGRVVSSKNDNDRELRLRLMKTAVGLGVVTQGHGPYSPIHP